MKLRPWIITLSAGIFAALVLGGCSAINELTGSSPTPYQSSGEAPVTLASTTLTIEGRLVPQTSAWLGFLQPGWVTEVLVEEGQGVSEGELLARLGNDEKLDAALKAAELELLNARQGLADLIDKAELLASQSWQLLVTAQRRTLEAQQKLDDLDSDDYQQELDDAWETVQDEKDALDDAQEEFERFKDLSEDNANRRRAHDNLEDAQKQYDDALRSFERLKNDLELARSTAAEAVAALEDAQRTYEERKEGPAADDLALARARLDLASAQLAVAQANLANRELRAPFSGVVTRLNITQGELANAYQPLLQVADLSVWYVETTDLTENDVVKINPDRSVKIFPDAMPDKNFNGQVIRISSGFTEKAGDILYTVRIRLDVQDDDLRWGMTVGVEFDKK